MWADSSGPSAADPYLTAFPTLLPRCCLVLGVLCSQAGVRVNHSCVPQLPAKPTGLLGAQNKHQWVKEKGLATVDGKLRTPVLYSLPPVHG